MKKRKSKRCAKKVALKALKADIKNLRLTTAGRGELELRLADLYAQFLSGNADARRRMIEDGAPLARSLAAEFARKNEFRRPFLYELVSAAEAKLVEIAKGLDPLKPKGDIVGYLILSIKRAIAKTLHDTETGGACESYGIRVAYREPWARDNPKEIGLDQCKRNRQLYDDILCGYFAAEESMYCENQSLVEQIADAELAASSSETYKKRGALIRVGMIALVDLIHGFGKPHSTGKVVPLKKAPRETSAAVSSVTDTMPKLPHLHSAGCDELPQAARQRVQECRKLNATREENRARCERGHDDFRAQCKADYESGRRYTFHGNRTLVKRNVNQAIVWAIRTAMRRTPGLCKQVDNPSDDVGRDIWFKQIVSPDEGEAEGLLDIEEAIEYSLETDDERRLVDMRIAGLTLGEIAEQFDVTKSTVDRWLRQIGGRVGEQLQGLRDIQVFFDPSYAHEAIDNCCKTKTEHRIVTHRSQGDSDNETAEKLGLSVVAIKGIRNNVERLFRDHCRAIDGLFGIQPNESRYAIRWPCGEDRAGTKDDLGGGRWLRVDSSHSSARPASRARMKTPAPAFARLRR